VDATGRRTNATEIVKEEGGGWQTNTLSWAYDGLYRLTNEVCISTVSGASYTNAFQYDKAGNRWQQIRTRSGGTTTITNLHNANDQLLKEVTLVGGTPTVTNLYAHDANGSLVAKTNISSSSYTNLYGYDLKNKLSYVTSAGSGITNRFQYNDQGVRVRTIESGSTKYFLVDANNHTGYAQVLEERIGSTLTRSYVLGDDVLGQCGTDESSRRWLLYDGHGSTRQLADPSSGVTCRYSYEAYGQTLTTSTSGALQTDLLYCGEQFDSTLNMYNLRARYYSPSTGRFNARDSFMGHNEDPQSLHKYAYANLDPINGVDPSGQMTLLQTALVAGIIAGLITAVIVGIDSALAGKDTKNILFDAATGFLIGFSVGALLTLIGPAAFASIAPYVPYLLLLLGGWGAYDSFSEGLLAQGVFRIIVTILSVGLATPAARVKIQQFARYIWGKVFPAPNLTPSLIGNTNPRAGTDILKAVYNADTKQVRVQFPSTEGFHAEIVENAGWLNSRVVGGYLRYAGGKIVSSEWGPSASGTVPGTSELADEAAAAAQMIISAQ
jgi:RHS repeat-associated protein